MSKRSTPHLAVYTLLQKGNKVLLVRRYNTGWRDGDFTLPAGHVNEDETALQTVVRETNEEIGVTVKEQNLEIAHVVHRKKEENNPEYIDLYFRASRWKGDIRLGLSCDKSEWYELDNLPSNIIPVVEKVLGRISQGIMFSEDGY